jgi:eukaryotic-like serine/threonine-protein kinase
VSIHAGKTVLAGRYRLEEVIGRGGMSTVYRARDETLGRTVAVKVLLAVLAEQDPTYAARFEREARAAAALDNPTVVTVYDTGVDAGSHYIVMEYIAGRSLEQLLRGGVPLDVAEATRIAADVAGALAAAHRAGILHRDIKPANVMVTDAGAVKVLDFGIARRLDGTAITQVASVVGTAAYMAPERALGEPGDARADIYSLGCVLYAMLTGRPPFAGELSAAVLHQQINARPRPPSQLRPGLSAGLDGLVLAMLAKAPEQRPASADEVRDELLGAAGGPVTAATAVAPRSAAAAATTAVSPRAAAPPPPLASIRDRGQAGDHRRRAVVMALLTALITLIAVALLSSGGASNRSATHHTAATLRSHPATTRAQSTTTPTLTPAKPKADKAKPPKPNEPKPKATAPPPPGAPPGQGGQPPGQAKKHGGDGGD